MLDDLQNAKIIDSENRMDPEMIRSAYNGMKYMCKCIQANGNTFSNE